MPRSCPDQALVEAARAAWDDALAMAERHGFRNAQVTVIAPTGTIGLVMDCDTTGIEPDFALVKFKKLAGGGYFKIINRMVPTALATLGYTRRADRGHRPLRGRPRHARAARPAINHATLAAKGFTDEVLAQARGDAADRLRHQVRVQPLHARRGVLQGARSGSTDAQLDDPALRPAAGARLLARRDRGRQHLLLRHHDRRGRAAPAGRASARCSTAPTPAAARASASSRSPATSR